MTPLFCYKGKAGLLKFYSPNKVVVYLFRWYRENNLVIVR